MTRVLSFTEIDAALACWARWDFAYGGRLAGTTLKPKGTAPILSEGRAWGAAVAAWHQNAGKLTALWEAHQALTESLNADMIQMEEAGFRPDVDEMLDMEIKLGAMLDHYAAHAVPIVGLERLEEEIVVPIPSRSGTGRGSTRYRFLAKIDGFTDASGQRWVVEFKLRTRLTDPELLERQRQPLWYAWAKTRQGGPPIMGVIVDERLNEVPKLPKIVNARRKGEGIDGKVPSHKKDQVTTSEEYRELCHEFGELPRPDVVEALDRRIWQQRFPLVYRPSEMDTAGHELVSAAKLIRDLDSGELAPIRNAKRANCGYCKFSAICANPTDDLYVETLFNRSTPKRLKGAA